VVIDINGYYAAQLPGVPGNPLGSYSVALGEGAMAQGYSFRETAIGYQALFNSQSIYGLNTAIGSQALYSYFGGFNNTAIGSRALYNYQFGNQNIAIGADAGSNLVGLVPSSNNIYIGSVGASGDNDTIRIGGRSASFQAQTQFFASGIRGIKTGNNDAVPVLIDSAGQLGTINSSRRFKEDIQDMGDASNGLMRLRPVTFRYRTPFADGSKPIQYGLIAEEVAEVYPDLVAHSADGQIETVKYQVLDSMLLNEVQRQQKEIGDLKQQNQDLQERLARLEAAMTNVDSGAGVQ
jgi:hypothetical protein